MRGEAHGLARGAAGVRVTRGRRWPGSGSAARRAVWTRTGRPFFARRSGARLLLERVRAACADAGLFDELETSWLLLDAEIMPWSAKAGQLLRDQYAAVGAAAHAALPAAVSVLEAAAARGLDVVGVADAHAGAAAERRRRSPPPTSGTAGRLTAWTGVRVAPFQVLASQGCSHAARPHAWHLSLASRLAACDPALFAPTRHVYADTSDAASAARRPTGGRR